MLASNHQKNFDLFDEGVVSLVLEPGYNTFDWFVADGMAPQLELCGLFQGRVAQILQTVSTKIGFAHGVGSLNSGRVEQALVAGEMNLGHKKFSMEPNRNVAHNAASTRWWQSFCCGLTRPKRNFPHYLCGGGALHYVKALKARLPDLRIEVMDNSVTANARGFWLAPTLLRNRQLLRPNLAAIR